MVKLLLHSSKASWDSAEKAYKWTLSTRLKYPKALRLEDVSFIPSTTPTYPPVIYLRSKTLAAVIKNKHSTQVVGGSDTHDRSIDVLGILQESHATGRYKLDNPRRFVLTDQAHIGEIDFYFTEPDGTPLNGPYTAPEVDSYAALKSSYDAGNVHIIWDADFAGAMVKEGGGNATAKGGSSVQGEATRR